LNAAIERLRGALNDSARAPRYVETLAKRGYLFVAPLAAVFSPSDTVALEARKPQSDSRKLSKLHRWRLWLSVAAVMLAAPLAGWNWRSSLRRIVTPSRSPAIRSVAVLPLENLSGDASQEHPSKELLDLRALLLHRHQWVRMRVRMQNALQAIALANGLRRGPSLWSYDGQAKIACLPLLPHASCRRNALQAMYKMMQSGIENLTQEVAEQASHRALSETTK